MEPTKDDLATVATFNNTAEAGLAKERLENEGLDAFIIEGVAGGVMPYLMQGGGIHLQVRQEDLEQAREILRPAEEPGEEKA
jgi:hypothetical protein